MEKEYVPLLLDEIPWVRKKEDDYKISSTIYSEERQSSSFMFEATLHRKSQLISYSLKNLTTGEILEENSYDFLTEKGAMKWLYKNIANVNFYKRLNFSFPFRLEAIVNRVDKFPSYIDFIYKTTTSDVLKKEALLVSQYYKHYATDDYLCIENCEAPEDLYRYLQLNAPHIAKALLDFPEQNLVGNLDVTIGILNGDYDNELPRLCANSL